MSRYINPYTDFGFKKLFGQEASKDLLIDFLNAILPAHHRVQDLTFKVPEGLPDIATDRRAVFDIFCQSTTGEQFIVEMQKAEQAYFKDRTVFYATFPIRAQAKKGHWNFKLAHVYCIGVLDFIFSDIPAGEDGEEVEEVETTPRSRTSELDGNSGDALTIVKLRDQHGQIFYDKLTFTFLEMPRFQLREDELRTPLHKWMYFLKNLEDLENVPGILREPIFEKGFAIAELARMSASEQEAYELSLKYYRDFYNVMDTAEQKGYRRGLGKGYNQGYNKGLERNQAELQKAAAKLESERRRKEAAEAKAKEERRQKEEAEAKAAEERRQKEAAEAKAEEERRQKEEAEAKAAEERRQKEEAETKAAEERRQKEEAEAKAAEERRQKEAAEVKAEEERRQKEEAFEKWQRARQKMLDAGIDPDALDA